MTKPLIDLFNEPHSVTWPNGFRVMPEADAFDKWAEKEKLNTSMHPLHLLWLDRVTDTARQAWKAGISYASSRLNSVASIPDLYAIDKNGQAELVMSKALRDVKAERERQQGEEGWSIEHDDAYKEFQLSRAGSAYAINPIRRAHGQQDLQIEKTPPSTWPWNPCFWKPKNNRHDLIRAAALLIAEIERIDRETESAKSPNA